MGNEIGGYFKYNRSKMSTQTLKKPILSSSADHTSFTSNLTRTIISFQLENENSTEIKNTTDISNIDDIHSCVTPRKKYQCSGHIYTPWLTPLLYLLYLLRYQKQWNYPRLVNNICVFKLTANLLMLLNVSNQKY